MAKKKAAPRAPYFSGFCGPTATYSQHGHCRHVFSAVGVTPELTCACECHDPIETPTFADPVPSDEVVTPTFADPGDFMVEVMTLAGETLLAGPTRWAAFWIDAHGNRHVDGAYGSEEAAAGHIESLLTHGVLDVEQDMDVRSYVGEVPTW